MAKLSDKAFAIMAICPERMKYYGITVDEVRRNAYKFVWGLSQSIRIRLIEKDMTPSRFTAQWKWMSIILVALIAIANNTFFVRVGL